jgi:hypothetical protein
MRRLFLVAGLAFAFATPAFALPAAKVDRLMELFQVRKFAEQASNQMLTSGAAADMEPEQRRCVTRIFGIDAFFELMRTNYAEVYSDEAIADQTIAYFSTPSGKKVLDTVLKGGTAAQMNNLVSGFTAEEVKALNDFTASPAGALFQQLGNKLKPMQETGVKRMSAKAASNCGNIRRSTQ